MGADAALCLRCLTPLGSPRQIERRRCPICGRWYHATPCFRDHQRSHRTGPEKYWNNRRFWKA